MNPEDLFKNVEALTHKFQSQEGEISEESLQEYLQEVSSSLNQVFELVQTELDRGLESLDEARDSLLKEGLESDAEALSGVARHLNLAKQQLDLGQQVAGRKQDLQLCPTVIERERLLTPSVLHRLEELESRLPR